MRIPLTKVHRAFQELDRFTDDQCERFVRAVCKRGVRRFVHRAIVAAVTIPLLLLAVATGIYLSEKLDRAFRPGRLITVLIMLGSMGVPLLLAFVIGLVLKDWLLRRRIRFILRDRSVCPDCRYSLLGMAVGENNRVLCPECGMEVEADPSLNELADDDDGRVVFLPTERIERHLFWSPKRKRLAKRTGIVLGLLLLVVLPAILGGYELFLRRQAARATAERPGMDGIIEFIEAIQPRDLGPDEVNAWDLLAEADDERALIDVTVETSPEFADRDWIYGSPFAQFDQIYDPSEPRGDPEWDLENRNGRDLAEALLSEYRAAGVLKIMDRVCDARWTTSEPQIKQGDPAFSATLPLLTSVREWQRICAARMEQAFQRADLEEFSASLETLLALSRMTGDQATLIQSIVAASADHSAHIRIASILERHPDAAWLDAIERALEQQSPGRPRNHAAEGERLFAFDSIAWTFTDPGRVRLGRFSSVVSDVTGGWRPDPLEGRLGTYAENRNALNAYFDAFSAAMLVDPHAREAPPEHPERMLLLDLFLPAIQNTLNTFDTAEARRRATRVMIALERHYLAEGNYPPSLEALVPSYIDSLPPDPWLGTPFPYELLDPDAQRYLLYTAGTDGRDDDGGDREPGQTTPDLIFMPAE